MATRITFEASGKEYKLEMNAATVKRLERGGLNFSDIGSRILTVGEELFVAAFEMHHPSVRRDQRVEMYKAMLDYSDGEDDASTGLADTLLKMASEAIDNIKPAGNVVWKVEK